MFTTALLLTALSPSILAGPVKFPFGKGKPSPALPSSGMELINQVEVPDVAFASLVSRNNSQSLFLSTFSGNPFANNDGVYFARDTSSVLTETSDVVEKIEGTLVWPNTVTDAPVSVFGKPGIVAAGGFLVPGKNNGGIWFSET